MGQKLGSNNYIIRLLIIKHVLVGEFNDTIVQYDDIKP